MFKFTIIPGYRCNFKCAHCITGEKKAKRLSEEDVSNILDAVRRHRIRRINFAGGEPTLYISDIAGLLARIPWTVNIRMTTNGHFASTQAAAGRTLASLPNLRHVQLSYDIFHARFLRDANIRNLYEACREKGIGFSVILAVTSPKDLLLAGKLMKIGRFKIAVQKVLAGGRARKNGCAYSHPAFDKTVLGKSCPNRDTITYMCGQGFTACCSNLVFNSGSRRFVHPKLSAHLNSLFYKTISRLSFGKMMKKFRVPSSGLTAEHASPCGLCEHIFRTAYGEAL